MKNRYIFEAREDCSALWTLSKCHWCGCGPGTHSPVWTKKHSNNCVYKCYSERVNGMSWLAQRNEEWGMRCFCRNFLVAVQVEGDDPHSLVTWVTSPNACITRILNRSSHASLIPDISVAQSYHEKVPLWERISVDYNIDIGYNFLYVSRPPNTPNVSNIQNASKSSKPLLARVSSLVFVFQKIQITIIPESLIWLYRHPKI